MCQYFELRDLPAHRWSDRGFVFMICIVQVVGIKLKIQPYFLCPFHRGAFMCVILNSGRPEGGGVHGSTVVF